MDNEGPLGETKLPQQGERIMAIYIKFSGIDGEVDIINHEKWTEIRSFNVGVHKPTSGRTDIDAPVNRTEFHDIHLSKNTDISSPLLWLACAQGTPFETVNVHYVTTTKEGPNAITKYELQRVFITMFEQETTGDRPSDRMTLSYMMFRNIQVPVNPKGVLGPEIEFFWNVPQGKVV